MTLAELLKWHRRQVRETEGCLREVHQDAVRLLDGVIKKREAHNEARRTAVAKAIAAGKKPGRARIDADLEAKVKAMLTKGATVRMIMDETGVGASAIYRVKAEADGD